MSWRGWSAAAVVALAVAARPGGEDFGKRYPATLAHTEEGLGWECGSEDVWRLQSFELHQGSKLELACKKAVVAIGHHDTNALWAVVFPDKPIDIESELPGDREKADALVLRFAPADVERLFPSKTVAGPGPAWLRARADRLFRRKLGWKWSSQAGNSMVVPGGVVIADLDTREGKRRFYCVDRNAGSVEYVAEFESKPLPPLAPIAKKDALEAFDAVWDAFDREYAGFVLLPKLDWDAVRKELRPAAGEVDTVFDAAAVIADMTARLEDLHVWVRAGEDWLPGYQRNRPLNASWEATKRLVGELREAGKDLAYGRTSDGIGYLNVLGLDEHELPDAVDRALEELADTWAMVVDLRFDGGGQEDLAQRIAGRFLDEERVYSKNRYRSGSKRDALGPLLERRASPRGPWRYESPVVVLWGRKTMSSAESLALMLAQCPQVTTMGDRTAGSSGNPRRIELGCGIVVNQPRWLDMDPEEHPIEHVGVAPEVQLDFPPEAFTAEKDPVMAAALERLRAQPAPQRRPGRR